MKNNQEPLWTQEESIAYECAKETLNDIIGIYSSLIEQERDKPEPDLQHIEALHRRRLNSLKERDSIPWHDQALIARIRCEYGEKVRAYRDGVETLP